ncbi:GNAT family N-acetyltransferase [Streptomyces johnsoniae]|uniref:GNAT family N-acetyltransferase n=1 Tax=Streptomyces johnsoniae TaxID=3075532 RepID=A0ABU2S2D7_9ACTN|nr:GNAT family N-acetyltransferase [Streptomyces sp. DSM 41886]MDT0441765.1 GNAT family N-acetyltransferase [Streptomyces sp. DSM 41886]
MHTTITCTWRGPFGNDEVERLHAAGFGHPPADHDWRGQLERHSLGWVCARRPAGGALAGFCNVAWDGGGHAFLLDVVVERELRRAGIATALVATATEEARAAGCTWLHVDFEEHLRPFYLDACGFRPAPAGLIAL